MDQTTVQPRTRRRNRSLVRTLFIISLFLIGAAALVFGIEVFLLAFAGILFGVFLRSIANWISDQTDMGERWAVGLTTVLFVVIVGGGAWLLVPQISKQSSQLAETLPKAVEQLQQTIAEYGIGRSLLERAPEPKEMMSQANGSIMSTISSWFRITTKVIGNIVAIFFLGLFFAVSPGLYTKGILALSTRSYEPRLREILDELYITLARWLGGQLSAMAIVAVFTSLGLWAMGIEMALALGLLAGILAFIPNIGPIISAIPAVLLGLMDSPTRGLAIIGLYIGVQTVESYMITPLIQKRMVRLPPALILFAQFLMGVTLGAMALALATPLAAVVLVLVKMLYVQDILGKHSELPGDKSDGEADRQDEEPVQQGTT